MTIAFIHPHKSFLPELDAYREFFARFDINTVTISSGKTVPIKTDIEWHFMGRDNSMKTEGRVKIHEYASASAPPLNNLKNLSKKWMNVKPDYRIFLNPYVQSKFNFSDHIPSGFRDMGIDQAILNFPGDAVKKEYDFVYAGSTGRERELDRLLDHFTRDHLRSHSILIISRDYHRLQDRFSNQNHICFAGPVRHSELPAYLCKAKFAINFVPDKEPFNQQTSTKLLEYAALKIPVITSNYSWVRDFQHQYGGSFFYLKNDLSNFKMADIAAFNFLFPDLHSRSWDKQIRGSGVLEFIQSRFPQITF